MVNKTEMQTEETASTSQNETQENTEISEEGAETLSEEDENTEAESPPNEPEVATVEPTLESQLEEAKKQNQELQDRLLRLNAELENYKKRMAKENAEKFKYYHSGLIKELLPALDSMERALEHGQKENATIEAILEGIEMVYKLNQEALEKFSVSKVKAIGEPFDPTVHQAVGTVESDTIPEDHVVDQFQVGYLLHDRMIRPAMVRVSKKQSNS